MSNKIKSVLLITDGYPSANAGGISQTLYNLLGNWISPINVICRQQEKKMVGPVIAAEKLIYEFESFRNYQNRFFKLFNNRINQINFRRQQNLKSLPLGWPSPKDALVLVSTTEPIKLHFGWCLLRQGYTVIPYFMDDWLSDRQLKWKGGNIQEVAKDILQAAPCWLMISRQLEKTFRERYSLVKKPCLVVHNPAPGLTGDRLQGTDDSKSTVVCRQLSDVLVMNSTAIADCQLSPVNSHLIIYAGSIWPMHADALIAMAKAVHLMQETSSVVGRRSSVVPGLIIYTGEAHWKKYQSRLEGPGVTYGGWKTYADIQQILPSAWLLLCTASFDEKHKAYSDSSVQTKLTDYMAAGKPILFVGPSDAASGVFVEEWDIGFTVATQLPSDIAASLEAISRMDKAYDRKANNGTGLATTTFSKPVVQQKLYDFLEKYAMPAQVTGSSV